MLEAKHRNTKAAKHRESHEHFSRCSLPFALFVVQSLSRSSWSNPFCAVRDPIPFAVVTSSLLLEAKHRNTKAAKHRESHEHFSRCSLPFALFVVQSLAQWWFHLLCWRQSIGTRKPRNTAKVASSFRAIRSLSCSSWSNPFRAVRAPILFAVVASSLMLDTKHRNPKNTKHRESRDLFSRISLSFALFVIQSLSQWLLHLLCSTQSIGIRKPRNTAKVASSFRVFRSLSCCSWSNLFRAVRGPTPFAVVASSLMLDAKHRNPKAAKHRETHELFSRFSLSFALFVVQPLSRFSWSNPFRAVRGPTPFVLFVVQPPSSLIYFDIIDVLYSG